MRMHVHVHTQPLAHFVLHALSQEALTGAVLNADRGLVAAQVGMSRVGLREGTRLPAREHVPHLEGAGAKELVRI
jgi:hypothetical protein